MSSSLSAEQILTSEDERDALERVRELTGTAGGPMERHGLRCFLVSERLAADAATGSWSGRPSESGR